MRTTLKIILPLVVSVVVVSLLFAAYQVRTQKRILRNDLSRRDFSALSATNPIFDPATGNPDGTGRTQIQCNGVLNVICPDRISAAAKNLLALLPEPTLCAGSQTYLCGRHGLTVEHIARTIAGFGVQP